MLLHLLLFLGTCISSVFRSSDASLVDPRRCNQTQLFTWDDYFQAATSLNKAFDFFGDDVENNIFDGVLGVRFAEATMKGFIPELETIQRANPGNKKLRRALRKMKMLYRKAKELAKVSEAHIAMKLPIDDMAEMISDSFFSRKYPRRDLDLTLTTRVEGGRLTDNLTEKESDMGIPYAWQLAFKAEADFRDQIPGYIDLTLQCASEAFVEGGSDCERLTENCFTSMNRPNTKGYTITHQLLYLIVNQAIDCDDTMSKMAAKFFGTTVNLMIKSYCSDIYQEMRLQGAEGCIPLLNQDLTLEQITLCGFVGFRDFFRPEIIRQIPLWQRREGCFGEAPLDYGKDFEKVPRGPRIRYHNHIPRVQRPLQGDLGSNLGNDKSPVYGVETKSPSETEYFRGYFNRRISPTDDINADFQKIERLGKQRSRRVKRAEMVMSYDCLAHKTSLGIGAYSQALVFILDDLQRRHLL